MIAAWPGFNLTLGEFDNYTTTFGINLYSQVVSSGGYNVGSSNARTNLPVALLLARDGSASDWFPRGMQGGSANIRVFGRHTAGAFSSYFVFDYYAGMSWRFASGDLLNPDGTTNLGTGVQPDEEIVPLQSDLLAGRDTVYLRALDWVPHPARRAANEEARSSPSSRLFSPRATTQRARSRCPP